MSGRTASGLTRSVLVGAMSLLLSVLAAGPAMAHAGLASSDPADGSVLPKAPAAVTSVFTEPPDPGLSSVTVLNAAGQQVQVGAVQRGRPARSLVVRLTPDLPDGVYTVSWVVVSEADGHQTAGAYAFGVGVDPAGAPAPETPREGATGPTPASVAGKVALYLGIVLAIGTAFSGLWTVGSGLLDRRILSLSAGLLASAGAVTMLLAERTALGVSLGTLLTSSTGDAYRWLLAAAGALLAFAVVSAFTRGTGALALMGAAGIATALARAAGGHAAAGDPAWPQELAQTIHITVIGVWVGGFIPILLLLSERRRAGGPPPVEQVRRFSRAAGWAVLVVIVSGTFRVLDEAGGLGEVRRLLVDTSYGTALLVKLAIVAALIGLGAFNRRRSIPRLSTGDGLLGRVVAIETVGAVAVLATTAVLTGLSPVPTPAARPDRPAVVTASGSDFATTLRVKLTATPGAPGPNDFAADITDFDTGDPVEATAVAVAFEPVGRPEVNASQLDLLQSGSGAWVGNGTQLSLAGVWNVIVRVEAGARGTEVPLTLVTSVPGGQRVDTVREGGLADIVTVTLSDGSQLQSYVDAESNILHITAFDAKGDELPVDDILVVAIDDAGDPTVLDWTRFGDGHFAADADLDLGRWRFVVVATGEDGAVLQGTFGLEL